jgi:hypothetical protein
MLLLVLVAGCLAGCGPERARPVPDGWPERFGGRELYRCPHAYIYSSSGSGARDAAAIARRAAEAFRAEAGQDMPCGLIVVTGKGDPPPAEFGSLFALHSSQYAAFAGLCPDPPDSIARAYRAEKELDEARRGDILSLAVDVKLLTTPIGAMPAEIEDVLGLPEPVAGDVAWAFLLPTKGLCHKAGMDSWIAGAMQQPFGPLRLIPTAPVGHVLLSVAMDRTFEELHTTLVLHCMRACGPGEPDRRRAVLDYARRVEKRFGAVHGMY